MRRATLLWVGLLLLSVTRPVHAQTVGGEDPVPAGRNGPIQLLLEHREEMALTADQVARLQEIQARVEERNRPLVQRFLEIRRRWERERPANWATLPPARRRQLQERFQSGIRAESRDLGARVQANHRAAMLRVRGLLSSAQRVRLRSLLDDRSMGSSALDGGAALDLQTPGR